MGADLLTITEAAERLRRPTATLRYWRHKGIGPASFRVGGRVMYDAQALERWLDEQRAKSHRTEPVAS
jgi:DNA-binding transcriptional MerR regulator